MLTKKNFSKSKSEHNGHKSKNHVFLQMAMAENGKWTFLKCPKSICGRQTQNRFFFVIY